MTSDSTVVSLRQREEIEDPLTAVLRSGARRLLAQAVEAEAEAYLVAMKDMRLADGRERVVRHGHGPEGLVQTGIGPVAVRRVKLRDRGADAGSGGERIRFTSALLPRWARRTRSLDALLPILYLRGISAGDFQEALGALLGRDAPNLSPSVIARLRDAWEADYARWRRCDLSARHYVYVWADGVYLQARMEPQAECMLVLIGATPEGKKELLGFQVGMRDHHIIGGQKALAKAFQRRACHVDPAFMPKPAGFPDDHLPEGAVGIDSDHTSHPASSRSIKTGAAGDTTTTDSHSRRNRASRRGGQLLTRAHGST